MRVFGTRAHLWRGAFAAPLVVAATVLAGPAYGLGDVSGDGCPYLSDASVVTAMTPGGSAPTLSYERVQRTRRDQVFSYTACAAVNEAGPALVNISAGLMTFRGGVHWSESDPFVRQLCSDALGAQQAANDSVCHLLIRAANQRDPNKKLRLIAGALAGIGHAWRLLPGFGGNAGFKAQSDDWAGTTVWVYFARSQRLLSVNCTDTGNPPTFRNSRCALLTAASAATEIS
jgi:hypothetical protein